MLKLFWQLYINLLLSAICMLTITRIQTPSAQFDLHPVDILENNGYVAKRHELYTKDKYILELHQITLNYMGKVATKNYPVLIQHCFLGSSADFVISDRKGSLPMQLADAGYDVWLSNIRGNTYSRKHFDYTDSNKKFWDFSLHEPATIDLPTIIDFILKYTNKEHINLIGFSMGTSLFFIMAIEMPDYAERTVRTHISLAPVSNVSHSTSLFKYIAPYAMAIHNISTPFLKGCFMAQNPITTLVMKLICIENWTMNPLCLEQVIYKVGGTDTIHFDSSRIPYIIGHYPAGTSTKLGVHYAQFILTDVFCKVDLGKEKNMILYQNETPPLYDLSKMKVPVTILYAENDLLSPEEDALLLKKKIPKLMDAIKIDSPHFNHMDFLWAKDVTQHINDPIRKSLDIIDNPNWKYSGPLLYPPTPKNK